MYNICCFFLDLWEWKLRSRDCLAFTEVQNQLQICWQLSYRKVCMKLQQSVCSLKKLLVNAKRIPIFYGFGWTTKVVKCGMQNVPSFIFKWRRADVQAHYPQISRSQKKKLTIESTDNATIFISLVLCLWFCAILHIYLPQLCQH